LKDGDRVFLDDTRLETLAEALSVAIYPVTGVTELIETCVGKQSLPRSDS
jgi:NifB/MoaA-like Fe-S oxidoreductase